VPQLRLSFPPRPEYLVLGRLVLSGLARMQPIDPDSLRDLKLALTEAGSNAIRHVDAHPTCKVEIAYSIDDSRLTIEVSDEGPGFDRIPALCERDELDEGGLGLAIIQAVSDETQMGRKRDGSGSWIRFAKSLEPEES